MPARTPVSGQRFTQRDWFVPAMAGVAAGLVVVTAIVASALSIADADEPAASASASSEPTASPRFDEDDYAQGPDGLALPGRLTRDDRLPAHAQPMPHGKWASAQNGWALGIYDLQTTVYRDGEAVAEEGPVVLYLGTPDGEVYQALELPRGYDYDVIRWRPLETTAIITLWEEGSWIAPEPPPPPLYRQIDLLTGELSDPHFGELEAPYMLYMGKLSVTEELWALSDAPSENFDVAVPQRLVVRDYTGAVRTLAEFPVTRPKSAFYLSPAMDRVAATTPGQPTTVVETATGAITVIDPDAGSAGDCEDIGWYDEFTLVRSCWSSDGYEEAGSLERYSVLTNRALGPVLTYDTAQGQDLVFGAQVVRVGAYLLHPMAAPEADYMCRYTPFFIDDGNFYPSGWTSPPGEPQKQYFIFRVVEGKAYAITVGSCPSDVYLRELSVLDTVTNEATVIFPTITLERGQNSANSGLVSVVVGVR